ncbi:calcium/sodium antiporter [Salinibacterium sp. TMP30]|uniref:calcium/sodium antiporter n=1 Tax=Salinibacterium sp. TMP30 TaxID=3138237 RepID=UPI0031386ED2
MNALDVGLVVLGLIVLVGGGELLVRGASSLASSWGLSPLVIGLTVVAMGTSAPELAVSVEAVFRNEADLAIGNVVGSNIANVLLILGIAALILPLAVKQQLVRIDVPVMIGASVALLIFAADGIISLVDGLLLLALVLVHTAVTLILGRRETIALRKGAINDQSATEAVDAPTAHRPTFVVSVLFVLGGIGLLVVGANLLITGAVNIAASLGVGSLVIGLTVVAVGTSLPELVTSVIAAVRGQRDIAVGNIVGSCIANIGFVLGVPALISGGGILVAPAAVALDIPLMLAAAVVIAPLTFTGFTVQRWEGVMLVGLYLAYMTYVVLDATAHDAQSGFTWTMVLFVLPLLVLTVATTVFYDVRRRSNRRKSGQISPVKLT